MSLAEGKIMDNSRTVASASTANPGASAGSGRWLKIGGIVAVIAGVVALWATLPIGTWIEALRVWVSAQGLFGHVVFALVYALASVALAPGAALTLAAGFAFGLAGFPTVLAGATLGAGLSFLVGRHLARGWVERQVAGSPKFRAIDKAIESEGWKIVGLMRLSPLVPFNLQNYFFGITKIGFWPYLITTFFGIMPGTLLYVWIGSLSAAAGYTQMGEMAVAGAHTNTGYIKLAALAVGLVATLAVTILVSRKAAQKLREAGVDTKAA